ncbi:MAG: NRDE family protein [Lautropia sp.]
MCLIAWRLAPGTDWPLVLAANRDEFHAREASPLQRWDDAASSARAIAAGRDRQAGGTWLGVSSQAGVVRVGAVTNIRGRGPASRTAASRGTLVDGWLRSDEAPLAHLAALAGNGAQSLAGFNLVAIALAFGARAGRAPAIEAAHLDNRDAARVTRIGDGIGSVSNATLGVRWPKTDALEAALARACARLDAAREPLDALRSALFHALADRRPAPDDLLPDTGIDPARERLLSSAFIADGVYGTRCSTVVVVAADASVEIVERSFGPHGVPCGETLLRYDASGGVRS